MDSWIYPFIISETKLRLFIKNDVFIYKKQLSVRDLELIIEHWSHKSYYIEIVRLYYVQHMVIT